MPDELIADKMKRDPRIRQAQQLLLDALQEYQREITGIRPPYQDLIQKYDEILNQFTELRGGKLFFPYFGSGIGKGALVELLDGSIKYDMISGIGVHYLGHSHPDLLASSVEAALSDTIMQGHLQQNIDTFELSKLLIKASGLDHCFLSSSGVMANENALKIAFHKKGPAAQRILAFDRCFMGRTLTMAQITDKPSFREGIPLNLFVDYVPFYHDERPDESIKRSVAILKTYLARYPKQHAGMCFELVQGEAGFHPGTTEFFKALMQVLKEHEVPIIVDEVQTFGRTSRLFAFQHFHLDEYVDIVTIGKLSQVCATLFRKDFKPKPGLLSQTFTSSTSAIRASNLILKSLIEGQYFGPKGKIMQIHEAFLQRFQDIEKRHPNLISGPYGIGAMIAFTPYDGDLTRVTQFIHNLFQAGVISFTAGSHPARVRFLVPAGVITNDDIDKVMQIVEQVLI